MPEGADHAVVYNFMAHHQGMSIVAVANAVFEGRMRDRFHSDPVIEAAELLLQEKAPRDIPIATVRTEADERAKGVIRWSRAPIRGWCSTRRGALRSTSLMSNGRYSVMVTATGSGYSRWNELAVTRWQADPTEDRLGTYVFLRDVSTGEWWSATAEPKQAADELRADAALRRQGELHQDRRHAPHRGRVHRRLGGQWRRPPRHHHQ